MDKVIKVKSKESWMIILVIIWELLMVCAAIYSGYFINDEHMLNQSLIGMLLGMVVSMQVKIRAIEKLLKK